MSRMKKSRRRFITQAGQLGLAGGITSLGMSSLVSAAPTYLSKSYAGDLVRVGVLGTGGRGKNLIQNINHIEGMEVVACCDTLPFRLDEGMATCAGKAKGYSDYREVLDQQDVDAVIISTPLNTHFEIAKASMDAGKHVYCEKTMTFTIPETKDLEGIVSNSNLVFQVGYQHRYNPIYQKVYEYLQGDEFGPLSHIECYWNRNGDWRRPVPDPQYERAINWRMYREYSGGLMAELSSHQLNIVNWMRGGTPVRVAGFGGIDYWKDGRETFDNIHAIFEYDDGLKVNCTSLTTNARKGFRMDFFGKNASIRLVREKNYKAYLFVEPAYYQSMMKTEEVDGVSGATAQLMQGDPVLIYETTPGKEDAEPTRVALASFGDCIREDKKPVVGYESGRDSAICVALANKAMQSGEVIHWADHV